MKFWLLVCFLSATYFAVAQQEVITDTPKSTETTDSIKPHSVKKATILSVCLPGAGQVYNHIAMPKGKKKAYWKVPLIYAGLGVTGYFAVKNQLEQKALKTEYYARKENQPTNEKYSNYDLNGIVQLQKQKAMNRDLLFVGMGLVYLLQIADAAVEAHFVKFDISKDLAMRIRPTFQTAYGSVNGSVGVSLQLTFK